MALAGGLSIALGYKLAQAGRPAAITDSDV